MSCTIYGNDPASWFCTRHITFWHLYNLVHCMWMFEILILLLKFKLTYHLSWNDIWLFIFWWFSSGMLPWKRFSKPQIPCKEVSLPPCHWEKLEVFSINSEDFMVYLPRRGTETYPSCIPRLFFSFFPHSTHSKNQIWCICMHTVSSLPFSFSFFSTLLLQQKKSQNFLGSMSG